MTGAVGPKHGTVMTPPSRAQIYLEAWQAEGLEAGIIGINDPVPATPQSPFGGMKESGLGRELGHEGLEAYLETKAVSYKLRDA